MSVTTPDLSLDFVPLFPDETEEAILDRMIDWANEGLDPVADADLWVDTREGSHWRTCVMPIVREFARLYDLAGSEVPMSGFVLWAWETYLDDLAAVYEVERLAATPAVGFETFSGPAGTEIFDGTTIGAVPSTPEDPAPLFQVVGGGTIPDLGLGVGSIDLPIQATEGGSAGNVSADTITEESTPLADGVTFTNAVATGGGTDVESDDALRTRVLEAIAGKGPGNAADYVRWAGAWPGVGHVTVVPVWNGASTVLVMVADPNGLPLPAAIVAGLQQNLDPDPAKGSGTAPVGAHVTVETSSVLNIDVAVGLLTFETGYSWTGTGGTVALNVPITAAITRYFLTVPPGGTVRQAHVAGIFATWPGVDDATGVTLNGGGDVAVGLTPAQVPVVRSVTVP